MDKEDGVGDFPTAHKTGKDSRIIAVEHALSSNGRCQNLIVMQLDSGDWGGDLVFLRNIE